MTTRTPGLAEAFSPPSQDPMSRVPSATKPMELDYDFILRGASAVHECLNAYQPYVEEHDGMIYVALSSADVWPNVYLMVLMPHAAHRHAAEVRSALAGLTLGAIRDGKEQGDGEPKMHFLGEANLTHVRREEYNNVVDTLETSPTENELPSHVGRIQVFVRTMRDGQVVHAVMTPEKAAKYAADLQKEFGKLSKKDREAGLEDWTDREYALKERERLAEKHAAEAPAVEAPSREPTPTLADLKAAVRTFVRRALMRVIVWLGGGSDQ